MDKCAHPIHRQRRMALSGDVFGEKNIARSENFLGAVTDADLARTGERDTPLAARRVVPTVQVVPVHVILEYQCLGSDSRKEKLSSLLLIQFFEMRFAVRSGVESEELHIAPN